MNTKTLIAGLAFGLVSVNALAVEATRVNIPVTSLERTAIRAEIATFEATGVYSAGEAYGAFTYDALHGHSMLSRADVVAEMSLPKWQALMAARSDTYNAWQSPASVATGFAATAPDSILAGGQTRDFVGG